MVDPKQAAVDEPALTVLWHGDRSGGYTDVFPLPWFEKQGKRVGLWHEVVGPNGGRSKARCNISVKANAADLDYAAFPKENAGKFYLGVFRLIFSSPSRTSILQLQWKDAGKRVFSDIQATVGYALNEKFDSEVAAARQLSSDERRRLLASAPRLPRKISVVTEVYVRNHYVVAEVLERAAGTCEGCSQPAPFLRSRDGEPYLEVHHRNFLADGGEDTVENAIALCPNCHRQAHFGQ
jgi:hypothetical protein